MPRSIRVGLREANQRFSAVMKAVKAGKDVILTDRGTPIAVIKRLAPAATTDERVRELEIAGLLQVARRRGPMPRCRPRALRGSPLSQTVAHEREAR